MKKQTRVTYYCDFCNKHYHRIDSAIRHELGCTKNPGRECRLCGAKDISSLIEKYSRFSKKPTGEFLLSNGVVWDGEELTVEDLSDDVDGCPNCILAVIRCTNQDYFTFDYHDALKKWWDMENDDQRSFGCGDGGC